MILPVLRSRKAIEKWRMAFHSPDGRWALAELMRDSGLLQTIGNEQQRIAHNQAIALLENLGGLQGKNYRRIVDCILGSEIPVQAVTIQEPVTRTGTRRLLGH